jgi:hypothetical protein
MSFNNGPRTVVTGLSLLVDAADPLSYPGSGTSWTDIVTGITGSLSGSITYASDFKGTLVVNNSSSVIIFPTSSGNFGSNSFTVELAFQPNQINGQHWLVAKNSGSFPSWGAFITGSSGSGRITAFFNVSSTISCSMSTPTGSIVTGSNYLVDINFFPNTTLNTIYLNSELSGSIIPNGGGSLTATSSLFISNRNSGSSVGAPLEIFNTKLYTPKLVPGMIRQNYNSLSTRLGLSQKLSLPILEEGLLNLYPGAAAAYSLRSVNSDYDGAAIQVRNDSNAVANIGFTSNGDLDTIALLAHCGSGNGFVTEWFDQSGNGRNATQATALNQPQIVSAGSVITENGKPAVQFDGIDDYVEISNTLNSVFNSDFSIYSINSVINPSPTTTQCFFGVSDNISPFSNLITFDFEVDLDLRVIIRSNGVVIDRINTTFFTTNNLPTSIFIFEMQPTTLTTFFNSTQLTTGTDASFNLSLMNLNSQNFYIGARNLSVGPLPTNGNYSEFIIWDSSQSSNRTGIETNINDFYSIY